MTTARTHGTQARIAREHLPAVTLVGATGIIPFTKVQFFHNLVINSGVPARLDQWHADDRSVQAGGRPRQMSTETVLTLLILTTAEDQNQLVTEISRTIAERLDDQALNLLRLKKGRREYAKDWYTLVRSALDRVIETVDSKPGRHDKFLTHAEHQEVLAARDEEISAMKQVRLDWVTNALLQATMDVLPAEQWKTWKGDLTFDATVAPIWGSRGRPWQPADTKQSDLLMPFEYDGGWYLRTSKHEPTTAASKAKKAVFGFELTLTAMAKRDPSPATECDYPQLVIGIGMSAPGTDLIHTARRTVESIAERGHPRGHITGDRGYFAAAKPEDLQTPLRRLGYRILTDYKIDQLGVNGGYEGAIQVEGAFYCPSMPRPLINATKDFRDGRISWETWQKRIERRRVYKMKRHEAATRADGAVVMQCPARGSGATVECPLARGCGTAKKKEYSAKLEVTPPAENKRGKVCTNKATVTFPEEAGAKLLQDFHFGSKEWQAHYSSDRNTIEGVNGHLKSEGISLGDASKRRLRGYTAQYLCLTAQVMKENLRLIDQWGKERTEHKSVADREQHFARKNAARVKRKVASKTRVGAHDGLKGKVEEERKARAKKAAVAKPPVASKPPRTTK